MNTFKNFHKFFFLQAQCLYIRILEPMRTKFNFKLHLHFLFSSENAILFILYKISYRLMSMDIKRFLMYSHFSKRSKSKIVSAFEFLF